MTKFNPMSAWWETARAMNAAALTISLRNIDMAGQLRRGEVTPSRENIAMVSEKISAVTEGTIAASELWWRLALTPTRIPYDLGPSLAMEFVKPGYRKANANAQRLSRRRAR